MILAKPSNSLRLSNIAGISIKCQLFLALHWEQSRVQSDFIYLKSNNPMVGMTIDLAVAVEESLK